MLRWIKFGRRKGDRAKIRLAALLLLCFLPLLFLLVSSGIDLVTAGIRSKQDMDRLRAEIAQKVAAQEKLSIGRVYCYYPGNNNWHAEVVVDHGVGQDGLWVVDTVNGHRVTFSPVGCAFEQTTAMGESTHADQELHPSHG